MQRILGIAFIIFGLVAFLAAGVFVSNLNPTGNAFSVLGIYTIEVANNLASGPIVSDESVKPTSITGSRLLASSHDGDDSIESGNFFWPDKEEGFVPCGKRGEGDIIIGEPCNVCHVGEMSQNIINFIIRTLVPLLAIILVAWGGFEIITSGGNEDRYKSGRDRITKAVVGVAIVLLAWVLVNFFLSQLFKESISGDWWSFSCQVEQTGPISGVTPKPPPPPGGGGGFTPDGTTSEACRQSFNVASAAGCPDGHMTCVVANSLVDFVDCDPSGGGECKVSRETYSELQILLNAFRANASGQCQIGISSALQFNGGPSVSACHKDGNSKSGTCVDFNLKPYNEYCRGAFYRAASQSGVVNSFLDEYQSACRVESTTGGNIHTTF